MILRGGGIPNLEVLQNEVYNIVNGRGDQIRAFLGKLDTFTDQLNQQRDDITHAIDSTNRLLAYVGHRDGRPRSGADRHPAADQTFRRHQEPADQRRRRGGTAQPGRRPVPVGSTRAACTPTCSRCSARCGNSAVPRRI